MFLQLMLCRDNPRTSAFDFFELLFFLCNCAVYIFIYLTLAGYLTSLLGTVFLGLKDLPLPHQTLLLSVRPNSSICLV